MSGSLSLSVDSHASETLSSINEVNPLIGRGQKKEIDLNRQGVLLTETTHLYKKGKKSLKEQTDRDHGYIYNK